MFWQKWVCRAWVKGGENLPRPQVCFQLLIVLGQNKTKDKKWKKKKRNVDKNIRLS